MPRALSTLFVLAPLTATAAPPPHNKQIVEWATAADYKLSLFKNCKGLEEKYFGAMGSVCWSARSGQEQAPSGSRTFPRVAITLAVYPDEAKAKARIARFHDVPEKLEGEPRKAYPLRAGFRLGTRVLIVTTDALAFQRDAYRAASELAKATGGTELACWTKCVP